jgi:hypothetical protein
MSVAVPEMLIGPRLGDNSACELCAQLCDCATGSDQLPRLVVSRFRGGDHLCRRQARRPTLDHQVAAEGAASALGVVGLILGVGNCERGDVKASVAKSAG